jgi:HSP20 family protein
MSTLIPWGPRFVDPFAFAPVFRRPAPSRGRSWFAPTTDVVRDGEDAVLRVELPGVDVAKDVTVEVVGDRLTVHGERREENSGEGWRESRSGSFRRTFTLPQHLAADAVTASYDAGVLTVRVAGAHAEATEPGARRIAIEGVAQPEARPESPEEPTGSDESGSAAA